LEIDDEVKIKSQNVYFEYSKYPKEKVYQGQIIHVILRTRLFGSDFYNKIQYKFYDGVGLKRLNNEPHREMIDENGVISVYDTFYFKIEDTYVKTPRINIYFSGNPQYLASLSGKRIQSIALPCEMITNCSGIFAKSITIEKTLANKYDEENNILTIFISGIETDLKGIHFDEPYIKEQGYETENSSKNFLKSRAVYYIVVPKYYNTFKLNYFNTEDFSVKEILLDIDVRDDMVTTAKDLRPKHINQTRNLKIAIFSSLGIGLIALFYFYRRYIFIVFSVASFTFVIFLSIPQDSVCIKGGTVVKILPMSYSTNFKEIEERSIFEKVAERDAFVKITLSENSEGWVRRESVCED
jgi:hypothetical protein